MGIKSFIVKPLEDTFRLKIGQFLLNFNVSKVITNLLLTLLGRNKYYSEEILLERFLSDNV